MSKCLVVERPDGGVDVIHPAPGSRREGEAEEAWLERVRTRAIGDRPVTVLDTSDLPSREHRDEWRLHNGKVKRGRDIQPD